MFIVDLKHYEVPAQEFWTAGQMMGISGYDMMDFAEPRKWHAISCWGSKGWDLGSWPLVVIYVRQLIPAHWDIAYYVEGDVTCYSCQSEIARNAIIDELAFFHWKMQEESWVQGYDSVAMLPDELRGPYRG